MHRLLFVLLAAQDLCSLRADSWTEVPESRSPDGKCALFYQHGKDTSGGRNPPYVLYFFDLHHSPASAQLVPDLRGKTTYDDDGTSAQMLLSEIAARSESLHAGKRVDEDDAAASYKVQWTADSCWVSLEGGSHKFYYLELWHLERGRFEQMNPEALHNLMLPGSAWKKELSTGPAIP